MPNNASLKKPYLLWNDRGEILRRANLGVREAVRDHALAGRSVAVYRHGTVILLSPDDVLKTAPLCAEPELAPTK